MGRAAAALGETAFKETNTLHFMREVHMPFGFSHLKISTCWCFGECQVSSSIQHRTAGCHIGLKILQEAAESWPGEQDRQRKKDAEES